MAIDGEPRDMPPAASTPAVVPAPAAASANPDLDLDLCAPDEVGMDPASLDRALALAAAWPGQGALCVLRRGRVVLHRSWNCPLDSLFMLWSAGKPLAALSVHLLAERGQLSLDAPVSDHWPEYARNGKAAITVRQVLQHRSGAPVATRSVLGDALIMADWDRSVRRAAAARPIYPVGQVPAYHILSYGFVLGELVRRVSGVPVAQFARTELLEPLGLRDVHLELPEHDRHRRMPLLAPAGDRSARLKRLYFNRGAAVRAVIPAANVTSSARDLALFYQMLLRGGELGGELAGDLGGVRVLAAETVAEARRPSTRDGEMDRLLQLPVRWAQGFQLGGGTDADRTARPMGSLSGRETFGHNGSNYCIGWADPTLDLAFAYLTNLLAPAEQAVRQLAAVSDAVLDACR